MSRSIAKQEPTTDRQTDRARDKQDDSEKDKPSAKSDKLQQLKTKENEKETGERDRSRGGNQNKYR